MATTWVQTDFRFRNDDGSESAATWKAAAHTNITPSLLSTETYLFRIRLATLQTGTTSAALTGRLYIAKNGGSYAQASSSSINGCKVVDSTYLTDDAATTQQLTAGTFVAGKVDDVSGQCTATASMAQNRDTEHEFMLQLTGSQLANGDYFDFRMRNSTTAYTTYTYTGRVTVTITYPAISTLTDNFDDNSIDSAKWSTSTTSATVSETSQQLQIACNASTSGAVGRLISVGSYNLTGDSCFVKVVQVANGAMETEFRLYYVDSSNMVSLLQTGGTLFACQNVGGSYSTPASIAYNASTMLYWRIREASGTTYWEYSANGSSWTTLYSAANPIAVTSLQASLICYEPSSIASPGTAIYDDFNIVPGAGVTIPVFFHQLRQQGIA